MLVIYSIPTRRYTMQDMARERAFKPKIYDARYQVREMNANWLV